MIIEENSELRTVRRNTPVGVAVRYPHHLAARSVFEIERAENQVASREVADEAQLGGRLRTLEVDDPLFLQYQVRRPSGERLAHQGCGEGNVRRPGCGEIKNLRSIRAHTRERNARALHQDLGSSFINILL